MASPFVEGRVSPREVLCVLLHWLATGASVRAQEQFFLDKSFLTIHSYRSIGAKAVLKGLVSNVFYGDDINNPKRLAATKSAFGALDPCLNCCLGAIDGTHIPIFVPTSLSERYRNR
jgi:hypothetical protein